MTGVATHVRLSPMDPGTGVVVGVPGAATDQLSYALKRLGMAAAVLQIGAHPDDEDTGTIAYLARGLGARTVYWSATRGEGSQNRIGSERAEALGVLRTWESLAARAIDGGQVIYGPFYDFGFSKTAEDAFARWSREEMVWEIARAIRLSQPLVVISRWSGDLHDGHGQHQAVGQAVRDAWSIAADPTEAMLDLPAWEPRKLYRALAGDWQPGEDGSPGARVHGYETAGHLRIDTGQFDPISGRSYQELGNLALNQHRTQGMAFAPERGAYYVYYRRELGFGPAPGAEAGFFDGLEPRLRGLAEYPGGGNARLGERLGAADDLIDTAVERFRPERPAPAGEVLLEALALLGEVRLTLPELIPAGDLHAALDRYLAGKEQEVAAVAARCLGLRLECLLDEHRLTPGARLSARTRLWSAAGADVRAADLRLELPAQWSAEVLAAPDSPDDIQLAAAVDHAVRVARGRWAASPYWLRTPRRPYRYVWPGAGPLSLPLDPPLVSVRGELNVGGKRLELRAPGYRRRAVPGGIGALALNVLPPIALEPHSRLVLLPAGGLGKTLKVPIRTRCLREDGEAGTVGLACPAGWMVEPAAVDVALAAGGAERTIEFEVRVPAEAQVGVHSLRAVVVTDDGSYGVELEPVRLGLGPGSADEGSCVAETFVPRLSAVDVHVIDVEFAPHRRYAYVPGLADRIVESLDQLGANISVVPGEQLAFASLAAFDTIVIGPDAYNVSSPVRANAERLLEYTAAGGTLVVQHQTYGYAEPGLAPYPFTYSQPHDRVTLPDAPVEVLAGARQALTGPNCISSTDWDGWVHDRGVYFFGTWDPRYIALLSCHDPGEAPRRGGLMTADYGQGTYVYAGYSFARQIPVGVRGAIRLFANLLGLGRDRLAA